MKSDLRIPTQEFSDQAKLDEIVKAIEVELGWKNLLGSVRSNMKVLLPIIQNHLNSDLAMAETKPHTCEYCDNAILDDCKIPNCGILKCVSKVPAWVQDHRKPYDNYVSMHDGIDCLLWVQLLEDK